MVEARPAILVVSARLLGGRSTVGLRALDADIGVRIPASQPQVFQPVSLQRLRVRNRDPRILPSPNSLQCAGSPTVAGAMACRLSDIRPQFESHRG